MNRRVLVSLVVSLVMGGLAAGQMADVSPRAARVTAERAEVRCGSGSDGWYSVGRAPAGTVLTVDGREGEWLRVSYPAGLGFGVLLRVDEVELDEAAGTAKLTRPARPIYRNRENPVGGSWMKLNGDPFAPGTEFGVIEVLSDRGAASMVLVEAPDRVRGYVLASDVEMVEGEVSENGGASGEDEPVGAPAVERPAVPADAGGDESAEAGGDEAPAAGAGEEAGGDGGAGGARAGATAEQLYAAYDAVVREPVEDAELEPLIDEFRAALGAVDPGSPDRSRLQARLDLLEIRVDLQRDLRAVTSATERAAREREAIDRLVVDWRSRPTYTVVGQLMASALYDGRRLPLMYRLQSLDGPGGRTIAYILPSDELDLNAKVGGVVGVVGEARRDRTIKVRLIDPVRVDVLEPGR